MNKSINSLITEVRKKLSGIYDPAGGWNHRADHLIRVMRISQNFLKKYRTKYKVNKQAVLIGALLHDIGVVKIMKERKDNVNSWGEGKDKHLIYGVEVAESMLKNKFRDETIELVKKIIKNHHRLHPPDIETKIVQDADNLDELGYICVWKTISYNLYQKNNLEATINYWKKIGIKKQINNLKNFNLKEFREMAKKRIQKFKIFINEIEKEMLGKN